MDIQVNMEKVLAITQERLAAVSTENIMLQAVVQDQQESISQLREALDKANENNLDKTGE